MTDKAMTAEMLTFMTPDTRPDLQYLAMQYFLGLSGSVSSRQFLYDNTEYVDRILLLACGNVRNVVSDALSCLVNLAGDETGAHIIMNSKNSLPFIDTLLSNVIERQSSLADVIAMLLSNLSRRSAEAEVLVKVLQGADPPATLHKLIFAMCNMVYNTAGADLHFLAPLLANLSQIQATREILLGGEHCDLVKQLLPLTQHQSDVRRQGIASVLKNCCFHTEYHEKLFEIDILPALLLPLAGPEEFDEEDMEKLPVELQYLEKGKVREPIAAVRHCLTEAITQLCATKNGRMKMKEANVYVIVREYHKWEKDTNNEHVIMNLIDLLIGDEPDPKFSSNLKEVEVPAAYQDEFDKEKEAIQAELCAADASQSL